MKARIDLQKGKIKRTINLRDNNLLITFNSPVEAESAYTHLKNEMAKDGWKAPAIEEKVVKIKRSRYRRVMGRKVRMEE